MGQIVGQQSELYSLFFGQISGTDSGVAVRTVQTVLWADQGNSTVVWCALSRSGEQQSGELKKLYTLCFEQIRGIAVRGT